MYIFRILLLGRGFILYVKQVADSGPGLPTDLVLSSWEIAAGRVVASCSGRGELVSWACILEESRRVFVMR